MATIRRPGEAVKVTIVSHTVDPIRSIALAQLNMTGNMRHDILGEFKGELDRMEAVKIFEDICKTELQGAFEFVHFNIQMEGVSRAFQQQLTRTRLAAYSAESLRFTESGMEVLAGPSIIAGHEGHEEYDGQIVESWDDPLSIYASACDIIEGTYERLIQLGVPVEDARGILPLNVLSKIGMSVSYKTLIHMSRVRMCYQSQAGEWNFVFKRIVEELGAIDPLLTRPLGAFCDHGQRCPFGSKLDRKCERNR